MTRPRPKAERIQSIVAGEEGALTHQELAKKIAWGGGRVGQFEYAAIQRAVNFGMVEQRGGRMFTVAERRGFVPWRKRESE